ncbi:MAG: hypothetical protein WBO10_00225 [Pyrinomonadaceae bacterium]
MANLSYQDLIAKLTLQAANIGTYTSKVDATPEEIDDCTNDLANLEAADEYADVVDGNKKTVFQIKQALFNGDENVEIPPYPVFPAGTLPEPPKAGALQRFQERGRRWKTATGWTPEVGTALGYGVTETSHSPSEVKPEIEVFAAASNYHFSIVVSKRGEANMWDIYILRKNGSWTKVDSASGKSADVHITPTSPGDPEQLQVRVQLRKSNEDYGQPSDPAYVTVNP